MSGCHCSTSRLVCGGWAERISTFPTTKWVLSFERLELTRFDEWQKTYCKFLTYLSVSGSSLVSDPLRRCQSQPTTSNIWGTRGRINRLLCIHIMTRVCSIEDLVGYNKLMTLNLSHNSVKSVTRSSEENIAINNLQSFDLSCNHLQVIHPLGQCPASLQHLKSANSDSMNIWELFTKNNLFPSQFSLHFPAWSIWTSHTMLYTRWPSHRSSSLASSASTCLITVSSRRPTSCSILLLSWETSTFQTIPSQFYKVSEVTICQSL